MRNIQAHQPNHDLFPHFDDTLRDAMATETALFFRSQVHENRSVLDLLRADYTFLNEPLARHYGVPNVYGGHFRRAQVYGNFFPPGGWIVPDSGHGRGRYSGQGRGRYSGQGRGRYSGQGRGAITLRDLEIDSIGLRSRPDIQKRKQQSGAAPQRKREQ